MIKVDYIRREIELHLLDDHKLDDTVQKVYDNTKHHFHKYTEETWFSKDGIRTAVIYEEVKTCTLSQKFTTSFFSEFNNVLDFNTKQIFFYVVKLGTGVDISDYDIYVD